MILLCEGGANHEGQAYPAAEALHRSVPAAAHQNEGIQVPVPFLRTELGTSQFWYQRVCLFLATRERIILVFLCHRLLAGREIQTQFFV